MSIRWGVLGAGGIASTFVRDLAGAGISVTAVGSRDLGRARAFADEHDVPRAHGSYDDLVADPGVDVVYVATPHVLHREHALLALAAGKHVLVEKPFTVSAAEAEEVLDAARAAGLVALDAMWTRYTPQSAFIREVVRSGTIGEPRLLTATHLQALPTDPRHRVNDPALGGGALLDLGVYPVAFAHDVLGPVAEVAAVGTLSEQGVDRRVGVSFRHEGGGSSQLFAALDTPGGDVAVVHGTEGRLEVDPNWHEPGGVTVFDRDGNVVDRRVADEGGLRGMQHQAAELERLVAAGELESPLLPARGTLEVMRTLDEVRRQIGVRYPGEQRGDASVS